MDVLTVVCILSAYLGGLPQNMYFIFFQYWMLLLQREYREAESRVVKHLPHTKKKVPDKMKSSNYCYNTYILGQFLRKKHEKFDLGFLQNRNHRA